MPVDDPHAAPFFLRTLARARWAANTGSWDDAVALWEQVVAANPVDGDFWARLGDACYHVKRYARAVEAFERALELGQLAYRSDSDVSGYGFPFDVAYAVARCHALAGDREQALTWLEQAFDLGFRDLDRARVEDDFQPLRDDARYREIVGLVDTSGMSRDEGRRADLAFLAREAKRRGYRSKWHASEAQFDAAVAQLNDALPGLTDMQVLVELMKIMRCIGDGHSGVVALEEPLGPLRAIPVLPFLFEDGTFIIAAAPEYAALLGAELLTIDERPVGDILHALDTLMTRDNEQTPRMRLPFRLRELPLLHAMGLIADPDRARLAVRLPTGEERSVVLEADPSLPMDRLWRVFPNCPGWTFLPDALSVPLPHYLKNAGLNYWFEYLPAQRTLYFQFNRVLDDPAESLAAFTARLFAFIGSHEVDRLVIDVRWNNGGNTFKELPLVHGLIGSPLNRRGALFVIIGRKTFSACQNFCTFLDRHTAAIFVGEPTGASPNFVGESSGFTLPYSKLYVNVSDLYWQTSWPMDERTWIAPLIYAPPTFAAFRENRDPALEAILSLREHLPGM